MTQAFKVSTIKQYCDDEAEERSQMTNMGTFCLRPKCPLCNVAM